MKRNTTSISKEWRGVAYIFHLVTVNNAISFFYPKWKNNDISFIYKINTKKSSWHICVYINTRRTHWSNALKSVFLCEKFWEREEEEMSTSESEGQVIGCHTDATWTEQLQKANDNKKLVCFSIYVQFFDFLSPLHDLLPSTISGWFGDCFCSEICWFLRYFSIFEICFPFQLFT